MINARQASVSERKITPHKNLRERKKFHVCGSRVSTLGLFYFVLGLMSQFSVTSACIPVMSQYKNVWNVRLKRNL